MMRKICFLFALMSIIGMNATSFEMDGICYEFLDSQSVMVVNKHSGQTGFVVDDGYVGDIIIPSSVVYGGVTYHVTAVSESAFTGASSLTSVLLPSTISTIGIASFASCSSLVSFYVDEANPSYSSVDGVLYNKTLTTLVACPGGKRGSFTIPNTVVTIEESAFQGCSKLTTVTMPSSVSIIGSSAFFACTGITSLVIPNGVSSILPSTFSNCSSLSSISLPATLTEIGSSAFFHCTNLKNITLPQSVISIYSSAFSGCSSLSNILLPSHLETLGNNVFEGCKNLSSMTIPASVTTIGSNVWGNCSNLTAILVENGNPAYSSKNGVLFNKEKSKLIRFPIGKKGNYTVPSTVIEIGDYSFTHCSNLVNISLPSSLSKIGSYAFYSCTGLSSLTFPGSMVSFGQYAFAYCSGLSSMILYPSSVPKLQSNTFSSYAYTNISLFVPAKSLEKYKKAAVWKYFSDINPLTEDFTVTSEDCYAGCTSLFHVSLKTVETGMTGCCFDLHLPEGVSPLTNADGSVKASMEAERIDGGEPSVAMTQVDELTWHVEVSLGGGVLVGNEGLFLHLYVDLDDEIEAGYAGGYIDNAVVTVAEGTTSLDESGFGIDVVDALRGDVNLSGNLSVTDVTLTVDKILGKEGQGFIWQLGDMNKDGLITVADITMLVDAILSN